MTLTREAFAYVPEGSDMSHTAVRFRGKPLDVQKAMEPYFANGWVIVPGSGTVANQLHEVAMYQPADYKFRAEHRRQFLQLARKHNSSEPKEAYMQRLKEKLCWPTP